MMLKMFLIFEGENKRRRALGHASGKPAPGLSEVRNDLSISRTPTQSLDMPKALEAALPVLSLSSSETSRNCRSKHTEVDMLIRIEVASALLSTKFLNILGGEKFVAASHRGLGPQLLLPSVGHARELGNSRESMVLLCEVASPRELPILQVLGNCAYRTGERPPPLGCTTGPHANLDCMQTVRTLRDGCAALRLRPAFGRRGSHEKPCVVCRSANRRRDTKVLLFSDPDHPADEAR